MRNKTFVRIVAIVLAAIMALSLLYVVLQSFAGAGAVTQSQIDELKRKSKELQQKKQQVQSQINTLQYEQSSAMAKKAVLDDQIALTEEEIGNITEQIEAYKVLIADKEVEVVQAQAREEAQWELYKSRMRDMEENGAITYIAIVFDANSFADLLSSIDFIGDVMQSDQKAYEDLGQARLDTIAAKEQLEAAEAASEVEKEHLVEKQTELAFEIEESVLLILQLDDELETHNEMYDALDADADKIQKEINDKTAELKRQQEAATSGSTVRGTGNLIWPSNASNVVTSFFGTRFHPIYKEYRTHNGTDIGAAYGTNILAADSGTVITSTYSSSYGNYVVISHGNGMTTLYAHMSTRLVSDGQAVAQGSVIGRVGSTGASTGPHLHFEVSVDGRRVDPLSYFASGSYTISPNA
jgi:murein DD-endopeptidase MepM/ murein hydrolase activator NlpD